MTTFTLRDYIDNMSQKEKQEVSNMIDKYEELKKTEPKDAEVLVEPIPFAGYVNIQDKEDTEQMLRDQLHLVRDQLLVLQAENQRLKRKLRALGENE